MARLLTTREAAELLGVGTTSVKRWADEGVLPCVKTPGGHRRFPISGVEAMVHDRGNYELSAANDQSSDDWIDILVRGTSPHDVYRRLCDERDRAGVWWQVCEELAGVLVEIGRLWESGQLSVLQEHLASERLARGLSRCAEDISPRAGAPTALLVVAEGDDHTLGLGLAELVLREAGFVTRWAGRRTPRPALEAFLAGSQVALLAVSASSSSTDRGALADYAAWLGEVCRRSGTQLALGGSGAWPVHPPYGARIDSFDSLSRYARSLAG